MHILPAGSMRLRHPWLAGNEPMATWLETTRAGLQAWMPMTTNERKVGAFTFLRDRVSHDAANEGLSKQDADVLAREFFGMSYDAAWDMYVDASDAYAKRAADARTAHVQSIVGVQPGTADMRDGYTKLRDWLRCDNATAPWPWPDSWARNLCYVRNALLGAVAIGTAAFTLYLVRGMAPD